jgi:hypothetical protein
MAVPVSRPDQPNVFLDAISWLVNSSSTLSYAIYRLKSALLTINVSSAVSMLRTLYPTIGNKLVDGYAVNTKTLG